MGDSEFQELVWQKAGELYRPMPWRDDPSLYRVLVSELMLQQTQVPRVLVKFAEFVHEFPDFEALARASLADVLRVWQGLGYNRRAKYLHESAKIIVSSDPPPATSAALVALPGVGRNTAAAIMNYVYDTPSAFVETNIRTVYFHHFFERRTAVSDKEVLVLVERTMDREHPRQWFWALMDYGASLKAQGLGRLQVSSHYKKQAPLKGSIREVRGMIVRELAARSFEAGALKQVIADDGRFEAAKRGLLRDGLIVETNGVLRLTK